MRKLIRPLILSLVSFAATAQARDHELTENGSVIILKAEYLCSEDLNTQSTHIVAFVSAKTFGWLREHASATPTIRIAETSLTVKVLRGSLRRVYGRAEDGRLVIFRVYEKE